MEERAFNRKVREGGAKAAKKTLISPFFANFAAVLCELCG
jgi:hypothetical protein